MSTFTANAPRSGPLRRRKPLALVGKRGKTLGQLDALLRQVVLERDGHRCRKCGAGKLPGRAGGLQAAHIKPKGAHPAMRYVVDNVLTLCAKDHLFWWHKDPTAAVAWAAQHLGQEHLDKLDMIARTRGRQRFDRELTRIYLEGELAYYRSLRSEVADG